MLHTVVVEPLLMCTLCVSCLSNSAEGRTACLGEVILRAAPRSISQIPYLGECRWGGGGGGANEHTLLMQQTNFVTERARHDRYSQENSCETVDTGEESISTSAIKETDHRVTIDGRNEI